MSFYDFEKETKKTGEILSDIFGVQYNQQLYFTV